MEVFPMNAFSGREHADVSEFIKGLQRFADGMTS
jgi:hypothetical protein